MTGRREPPEAEARRALEARLAIEGSKTALRGPDETVGGWIEPFDLIVDDGPPVLHGRWIGDRSQLQAIYLAWGFSLQGDALHQTYRGPGNLGALPWNARSR